MLREKQDISQRCESLMKIDLERTDGQVVALASNVLGSGASDEARSKEKDLLLDGLVAGSSLLSGKLRGVDTRESTREEVLALLDHGTAELGKNEGSGVDLGVVVPAVGDLTEGLGDDPVGVLGADDEADLTGGVCEGRREGEGEGKRGREEREEERKEMRERGKRGKRGKRGRRWEGDGDVNDRNSA
jgi:hypothetical protein